MNPRLIIEACQKEPNAAAKKNLALLRDLADLLPGVRVVVFPARQEVYQDVPKVTK